ncbi:MAG: YiiX family permuted papain-like enzyme [Aureispira sp.]|nr:YiiX family permuted papain-like enzyme [Aureispira sp.]
MKFILLFSFCVFMFWSCDTSSSTSENTKVEQSILKEFQSGDIIFHTSKSSQSLAIQKATKSKYSHMGIIYQKKDKSFHVFEAVQPVKITPLEEWINRGENKHFVTKRLKNSEEFLTKKKLLLMKETGEKHLGKDYDLLFGWSDRKMYCSELVWKIYKESLGIELGQLQQLKEFDLSDAIVQAKMKKRYGKNIPLEELVISPERIFNAKQLELVIEN